MEDFSKTVKLSDEDLQSRFKNVIDNLILVKKQKQRKEEKRQAAYTKEHKALQKFTTAWIVRELDEYRSYIENNGCVSVGLNNISCDLASICREKNFENFQHRDAVKEIVGFLIKESCKELSKNSKAKITSTSEKDGFVKIKVVLNEDC